jgi:hypothetical protein
MSFKSFLGGASLLLVAATVFTGVALIADAKAVTVDIAAGPNGWGCTTCFGGPPSVYNPASSPPGGPGLLVTLVNQGEPGPLQLTLPAGTYSITNADTTGNFSAWNFNTNDSPAVVAPERPDTVSVLHELR